MAISMGKGSIGVRRRWYSLKLDSLNSNENFLVDVFNSCTIPFRALIVPHHSVSSCSVLRVLTPT